MNKLVTSLTFLTFTVLLYGCFKNPGRSFGVKIDSDLSSHEFYLTITNQMDHEVVFDVFYSVKHDFYWRLCSGETVIRDSTMSHGTNSLILTDEFPTTMLAHDGRRIRLTAYFQDLKEYATNSTADYFLWHWYVWDNLSHKWAQECGQIKLKTKLGEN